MDYSNTHRDLVEACKNGSNNAQFELYNHYSRAMYNTCLRIVKNEHDAEDLLQNSFTDVFLNINNFRFQSSVGAWIKRIVVNNCINFIKKRKLKFEELDNNIQPFYSILEPELEVEYSVESVKACMGNLPQGYRVVFSLYLLEGYDHKEIAEILNVSEATSKSQYSRAKQKLRQLIVADELKSKKEI